MPGKIFINYRREGTTDTAGRLHDRIAQAFGLFPGSRRERECPRALLTIVRRARKKKYGDQRNKPPKKPKMPQWIVQEAKPLKTLRRSPFRLPAISTRSPLTPGTLLPTKVDPCRYLPPGNA